MQNIFTNIKCSEIILSNANENWYSMLYDLFSRLCYIATCGPFCKDATHIWFNFNWSTLSGTGNMFTPENAVGLMCDLEGRPKIKRMTLFCVIWSFFLSKIEPEN